MTLQHRKQARRFGCLYHALYALTGDASLLEEDVLRDVNNARFYIRAARAGYLILTAWVDASDYFRPVEPTWWDTLRSRLSGDDAYHLLITVQSQLHPEMRHMVAMLLGATGDVVISDSNKAELLTLSWEEFKVSLYGRAYQVECVVSSELDAYAPEDAVEILRERYGVAT